MWLLGCACSTGAGIRLFNRRLSGHSSCIGPPTHTRTQHTPHPQYPRYTHRKRALSSVRSGLDHYLSAHEEEQACQCFPRDLRTYFVLVTFRVFQLRMHTYLFRVPCTNFGRNGHGLGSVCTSVCTALRANTGYYS